MSERQLKVWDLFAGIGGFSLGLERTGHFKTTLFVEIEDYPQRVLMKNFPGVPIHGDIKTLETENRERPDVITGGYPCQPFSLAGEQLGEADERHLWPEMFRIICTVRPGWVVAENVPGHINLGLDTVISQMENIGYTCWVFIIPACAVGAPHRRDRVWIVANRRGEGSQRHPGDEPGGDEPGRQHQETDGPTGESGVCQPVANPGCSMPQECQGTGKRGDVGRQASIGTPGSGGLHGGEGLERWADRFTEQWATEPNVGRVADGIPARVDRLKCLGNAIVPQIAEIIGRMILEYDR